MMRPLAILALLAAHALAPPPAPGPTPPSPARTASALRLFDAVNVLIRANRASCNIDNIGELCVNPTNSCCVGGGFWPAGTQDQYVFNSGLQVAGMIPGLRTPAFPWPGDTVGAFFADLRGDQRVGQGLTRVFDGLDADDVLRWPGAAHATDPSVFAPLLLGRERVSTQDTWVRYWDGDTTLTNGRSHPAGLLVEQRTLAFRHPALEDAIFFAFRIVNVTARDPARYQGLAAAGYDAAAIADIAAIGGRFQDAVELKYQVQVPDSGYTIDSVYVAFSQDADVGQAGSNYTNGNLVFGTMLSYKADFSEPTWQYPLEIFAPPFLSGPGFVANAFLRTPPLGSGGPPAGVSLVSSWAKNVPFGYPVGVSRLWRSLSLNLLPTDGNCGVANPKARRLCYFVQTPSDARGVVVTGPTVLGPGQSVVLVMAQVHAAAVASYVTVGGNLVPGYAIEGSRLVSGLDTLRTIDRASGWVSHSDVNGNGRIEPGEVMTTPRSLYWKIQAAQAAADAGFLQPSAPVAPRSFVVPGDNRVTVVWERSSTETSGDPYFSVASNPATVLYDPDFRRFDVEGYRVWRGRSVQSMEVVAQFDYQGTTVADHTGQFLSSQVCAPELGITIGCPGFPVTIGLSGNLVQYKVGDKLLLSGGAVGILHADTAVTGGASGRAMLTDTRVPFVFVDSTVRNGLSYVYGVTAFDVNSIRSGPSTMESPLLVHPVTPRIGSGQLAGGTVTSAELIAGDGTILDPATPVPALDSVTGMFAGPMPPTNAISLDLVGLVPELLGETDVTVTVDSVIPGEWFNGTRPALYWFTAQGSVTTRFSVAIQGVQTSSAVDRTADAQFPALRLNAGAGSFGGDTNYLLEARLSLRANGMYRLTNQARASINNDPAGGNGTGSRWWAGSPNENVVDPVGLSCLSGAGTGGAPGSNPPVGFSCVLAAADLARNAGALPSVGIFNIHSYSTLGTTEPMRTTEGITAGLFRAADFRLYWGPSGRVDSVVDVTHHVRVPYHRKLRASWGILNDSSFVGLVNPANTPDSSASRITWGDAVCTAPAPAYLAALGQSVTNSCGGVANWPAADSGAVLMDHARLSPIVFAGSTTAGLRGLTNTTTTPATQTGFILYLNGEFFLMRMTLLPPAGDVWNLRTYAGNVTGTAGHYRFWPARRPAAVPGLRLRIATQAATFSAATNDSLFQHVHPVPDPYYFTNSLETGSAQRIRFVNLPAQAIIRIYSASGILVAMLAHNDTGSGEAEWDVRSRTGRRVASGVYFWHVETPDGRRKVGRMLVVNRGD